MKKQQKEFIGERAVPITTTIPYSKWLEIKKAKQSWNGLILRGWDANNGFNGLKERANHTEETIKQQERAIARFQKIIYDLQDKIDDLTKKGGVSSDN